MIENVKSESVKLENSSLRSCDQDLMQGAIHCKADLSDVIEDIEIANLYDIPQLIIEVILTFMCISSNFLTILVLRHAARKHPAQALRLALAAFELVAGALGCVASVSFHSYYLWCAVNDDWCQYDVEMIKYSNNRQILLILGTFPLIHQMVFRSVFSCSLHMPWIMSVERYFAICKPLKHKIYFSISNIRALVITLLILMLIQTIVWKSMEDTHLLMKCFYKPEIKFYFVGYSDRRIAMYQGLYDLSFVTINSTLSITFTSIVRLKLKKVKRLQEEKIHLKVSLNSINMSNSNINLSASEENNNSSVRQDVNSNPNKTNCTKQDDVVAMKIAPVTPTKRPILFLQQESVLDMAITHTWLVVLENTTFLLNASVYKYAAISERFEDAAPLGTVLYASFWFGMSSSFFNFLLYNIRIPAFREASWELITSVTRILKLCK